MIPKSLRKILNGLKRKNSLERKSHNVSSFARSEATYKKLVYNLHTYLTFCFINLYLFYRYPLQKYRASTVFVFYEHESLFPDVYCLKLCPIFLQKSL